MVVVVVSVVDCGWRVEAVMTDSGVDLFDRSDSISDDEVELDSVSEPEGLIERFCECNEMCDNPSNCSGW